MSCLGQVYPATLMVFYLCFSCKIIRIQLYETVRRYAQKPRYTRSLKQNPSFFTKTFITSREFSSVKERQKKFCCSKITTGDESIISNEEMIKIAGIVIRRNNMRSHCSTRHINSRPSFQQARTRDVGVSMRPWYSRQWEMSIRFWLLVDIP